MRQSRQRHNVSGAAALSAQMRGYGGAFPLQAAAARQNLRRLKAAAGIEVKDGALEKGSWMPPAELARIVTGGL
jgi:hypothetical protein